MSNKQLQLFATVQGQSLNKPRPCADAIRQLGSSHHAKYEREENDFYATDPIAVEKFLYCYLDRDKQPLSSNLWESSCGEGAISDILIKHGYNVFSSDLIDRGYGDIGDFFEYRESPIRGDIITNPPFKNIIGYIEHAMNLLENGERLILFMRLLVLEGKARYELFKKYPIKYVYVNSSRVICYRRDVENNSSSVMCFAWFVWEKGYNGETIIKFIP